MKSIILSIFCLFSALNLSAKDIRLQGSSSQIINETSRADLRFDQGRFRFWNKVDSKIAWDLIVQKGGTVEVILEMANQDHAGSEIYADLGGKRLKGKVIDTGAWDNYKPVSLGKIEIKEGTHTLTIGALTKPGRAIMDLRSVILRSPSAEIKTSAPPFAERPGRLNRLHSRHPSIDIADISINTPSGTPLKINGIDFLSDGTMVVGVWEPTGSVYFIKNYDDKSKMTITQYATGIQEPLGLKVVDDEIYIMQKQELTQLVDENKDGVCDFYKCISNSWVVSTNFHEFMFGPIYKDGYFYVAFAVAINHGGATTKPQVKDRGTFVKIDPKTGEYEVLAAGLRTPNGVGFLKDGSMFISDNQGDYLPGSKVMHMQKGKFYNHKYFPLHPYASRPVTPPVAWLPHVEIGNSPTDILEVEEGPYKGDLLIGDIHHGGLRRLALDKIGDTFQGTIFRFSQDLRGGTNRIRKTPNGSIAIGINGSNGNWGRGKRDGLLLMKWNDKVTFEMKDVRVMSNGLEVEFTKPLKTGQGWDPKFYKLDTWKYVPTKNYGGPKVDQHPLKIKSASVSADRKKVFLEVAGLKKEYLAHLILNENLVSEDDDSLFTAESWTTMNHIPSDRVAKVLTAPSDASKLGQLKEEKINPSVQIYKTMCASCHSLDGKKLVGPSFKGLLGKKQIVIDQNKAEKNIVVDTDYIREAITAPEKVHPKGYQPIMPNLSKTMTKKQIDDLVEWIKEQK